MSRLYLQWIDVAKLIEPLHLDKQRKQQQQQQQQQTSGNIDLQNAKTTSTSSNTSSPSPPSSIFKQTDPDIPTGSTILSDSRPPSSSCGDNGRAEREFSRALSCSTMTTTSDSGNSSTSPSSSSCSPPPPTHPDMMSMIMSNDLTPGGGRYSRRCEFNGTASRKRMAQDDSSGEHGGRDGLDQSLARRRPEMTPFELRERHTECIRIVRQLLDLLNEANLILLKAIICVLWHIAANCEHNMMSSQNLGVCIGQSLLNDEHQMKKGQSSTSNLYSMRSTSNLCSATPSSGGGAASALKHFSTTTFAKRHRRARSQCLLASTLSLTNLSHLSSSPSNGTTSAHNTSMTSQCYLDSSSAQDAAKYVPILVAFMIDNAMPLFGSDIVNLFGRRESMQLEEVKQQPEQNNQTSNRSFANKGSLASPQQTATVSAHNYTSGCAGNESTNIDNQSATHVTKSSTENKDEEKPKWKASTATQRLCFNSSDLVVRSNAAGLMNSPSAQATSPVKQHRRNLSTSVIVQVGGIEKALNNLSQGVTTALSDKSSAIPEDEMRVSSSSSPRLSEAGTTTSILIVNAPKATTRRLAGAASAEHKLGNQSTSSCSSNGCGSGDDEVDTCNRRNLRADAQSVSPSCGSSIDGANQQQQRPLSASESTGLSSRASSSTSGVHSESPAFSSETDTRNQRDDGQTTTCSSSISASISSPDPSSSTPSICTSPVDMVDGHMQGKVQSSTVAQEQSGDREVLISADRSRRSRYGVSERPKSMASLNDDELLQFRTGRNLLNQDDKLLLDSSNQFNNQHQQQHLNPSQDYVNFVGRQQQPSSANYAGQRSRSMLSQTLNRYSSASSHHVPADRMPKLPFQYTTSCYGGEAVLYYPSSAHLSHRQQQQQRYHLQPQGQAQQDISAQRVCTRIQSLDRNPQQQQQQQQQSWQSQSQLPQRSHVMMLRDYYLSLQEQSKQRQQALTNHQQRSANSLINQFQHSQQPQHLQQQQQQQQQQRAKQHPTSQQSVLVSRLQHHQVPSPNELARLQFQQQQGNPCASQTLLYRQQPASAAVAYQRIQPRLAKIRPNQFNGLYVKRAPSPSHLVADVARKAAGNSGESGLIVRPLDESDGGVGSHGCGPASMMALSQSSLSQQSSKMSSTENSADDESDDCSTGEWMESTMV